MPGLLLSRSSLFFCLTLAIHALGAVVSRDLHIVNANLSPDGFNRSTVVADGTFPGPLIHGSKGDNFRINVIDQLTDVNMRRATSVHWHGLTQSHTNEMDGVSWVTQCPIIPNESFLYNFNTPNQAGTFWYHSHLSTQYCDGLRGPLVIYGDDDIFQVKPFFSNGNFRKDPLDPHRRLYDIDDESTVITLADWYHGFATQLFPNPTNIPPTADSSLINGRGRYVGGSTNSSLAIIRARPGLRHRYRIVSTSCDPAFTFSIDNHNMTIIEVDGVETKPHTVDSITIYAAQRYSVIVTANQRVGNYWIRANPSAGNTGFDNGINSAILRYDGAPNEEPTSMQSTSSTSLNETDLQPLINPGAPGLPTPGGADVNINLAITFDATSGKWAVNGATFQSPSVPVLLQVLSGAQDASSLLPNGTVYGLPAKKVVEVSIPGGLNHPFHLHGHTFDVVRVAGSSTYNYANPVRRDVVSIGGAGDNVTFRFVTDNPGPWFLHCHIDWHLDGGLAIVFAEDTPHVASSNHNTTAWNNLCPHYNANDPDTQWE